VKAKIYQAGEPIPDKWGLQWQSDLMPGPAFLYFDTEEEAEAARVRIISGRVKGSRKKLITFR